MPKSCGNCEKYPMCGFQRRIAEVIYEENALKDAKNVFISIASSCKWYVEVRDDVAGDGD